MTETTLERFTERLIRVGSHYRAGVLVDCLDEATDEEAAALLLEWFNSCDALAPWADDLRAHFDRVGFITDSETPPELPCVVYRAAWEDSDPEDGLSWTTDLERAKWFASYLTSIRAEFLGIRRHDVDPWVWRAVCTEAYAYIEDRGEHEIVPASLAMIEPILVLTTEKNDDG